MEEKQKGKGLVISIIIITVVVVIGLIVGIILLTTGGKSNSEDNSVENSENGGSNGGKSGGNNGSGKSGSSKKDLLKNVDVELNCEIAGYNCLLIVTNNNDETVSLMGTNARIRKDENDQGIILYDPIYITALGPHRTTYYLLVIGMMDHNYTIIEPNFEIRDDIKVVDHSKDLVITSKLNQEKEDVEMTVENTSSSDINHSIITIIYYQDGKIVYASYDKGLYDENGNYTSEIKKNQKVTGVFDYPYGKTYKDKIAFDSYEIVVSEAYTKK